MFLPCRVSRSMAARGSGDEESRKEAESVTVKMTWAPAKAGVIVDGLETSAATTSMPQHESARALGEERLRVGARRL